MKQVGTIVDVQASSDGLDQGGGDGYRAGGRPKALHLVSFFLLHNPPQDSGSLDFPWHHWWSPQHAGDLGFLPPGTLPAPPWTPNPGPAPVTVTVSPLVQALTVFPHPQMLLFQCPHPPALWAVHKPLCNPGGQVLTPLPQVRFVSREGPRESRSAGVDIF